MRNPKSALLITGVLLVVFSTQVWPNIQWTPVPLPTRRWPDPSELPARTDLPDPLVMFDGRRVTTREQWELERKPELKDLIQYYMFGYLPPPPSNTVGVVDSTMEVSSGTEKRIRVSFGPPGTPQIRLWLVVPNRRPAPVFVVPTFGWNPFDRLGAARGYAIASFDYRDVFPEPTIGAWRQPDFFRGIFPYFMRPGQTNREPHDWGTISMWAWGVQRVVDYLVTDPDIDRHRIVATGHSRLGDAALVAAAYDERIAMVIPHQSDSITRTQRGREVARIKITQQPHHLNAFFAKFLDRVDRLPFDRHSLVALLGPRPILVSGGAEDPWSDLPGQFEMLRAASTVYRFLGVGGFEAATRPPIGKLVDSTIGYYIGEGGHQVNAQYWEVFLDFAGRHLRAGGS